FFNKIFSCSDGHKRSTCSFFFKNTSFFNTCTSSNPLIIGINHSFQDFISQHIIRNIRSYCSYSSCNFCHIKKIILSKILLLKRNSKLQKILILLQIKIKQKNSHYGEFKFCYQRNYATVSSVLSITT